MLAPISRRAFLKSTAAATATTAIATWKPRRVRADDKSATYPAGAYVDVHTHLGRVWNDSEHLSARLLLNWMDENDIAQAVVLPLVSPESSTFPLTSDFVLAETQPYRDRLIPFCCIDPRTSFTGGRKTLLDMLQRYVDGGAQGFGEHKTGVKIDDPRNMLLYDVCGELKLPVLYHSDTERNVDAPGLPGLETVLRTFPQTTFIAHATAWWSSISGGLDDPRQLGGYPGGKVEPGGAIDRLLHDYPNIYGDLSAGSGSNAILRDPEFGREFLIRWSHRLLFGTDYLSPGQKVPQLTLFRELNLPDDVQARIFRENARRVLRLAGGESGT